ncbi:phosphoribosyltransferase [Thamnocephalis sphaerospora]|uniref:Phosphoribosyltransferase n=1 Tax=Thamnocephalis sphaerospora TaxID=78915 RepID=A0A4P9XRQ8_9FUNG|nr:phosphoribosyltransferase [Thamnocephalis sphaerospora]|eukprot:RKP08783.1 phosphoribosyltransferase [Thamnocephalis sphaerospora]
MFGQNNRFSDRAAAGCILAAHLADNITDADPAHAVIVLALPRGGVPVAWPVAERLGAPLDVCLVRKLGVPGQEELAFGAIAPGGFVVYNESVCQMLGVSERTVAQVTDKEAIELMRRNEKYRQGRPPVDVHDKTVILVDDGIATGATMRVACRYIRSLQPRRLIAAAPIGAPDSCQAMRAEADEVVCLLQPRDFGSVGRGYDIFPQVQDHEVLVLLERARQRFVEGHEEASEACPHPAPWVKPVP